MGVRLTLYSPCKAWRDSGEFGLSSRASMRLRRSDVICGTAGCERLSFELSKVCMGFLPTLPGTKSALCYKYISVPHGCKCVGRAIHTALFMALVRLCRARA